MLSEFLKSLTPGVLLILRDDVYENITTREYVYQGTEIDDTIFLLHKSGRYGLHVRVEDIDWDAYQKAKSKVEERRPPSGAQKIDMRRHPRFLLNLPIEYSLGESDVTHAGYTFNASEGGVMANLPEQLDIGQQLRLKLFLSLGPDINAIEMFSHVVWRDNLEKEGGFRSGVKFVDISPENKNKLENFLNELSN
jgi:hypothetical protein